MSGYPAAVISHSILLRIVNLRPQIPSNFKHYFGYVFEDIFELGSTIKSQSFGT